MIPGLAILLVSAVSTQCVSGGAPYENVVVAFTEQNSAPLVGNFLSIASPDSDDVFAFGADYEEKFITNLLETETSIGLLSEDLALSIEENWQESLIDPIVDPPGVGGEIIEPIIPTPVPDIPPWDNGGNPGIGPARVPMKGIDHLFVNSLTDTYLNLMQVSYPSYELERDDMVLNMLDVKEVLGPLVTPDLAYFDGMVSGPGLADWVTNNLPPPVQTASDAFEVKLNSEANIFGDWFLGIDISPQSTAIAYNTFLGETTVLLSDPDFDPSTIFDFVHLVMKAYEHFQNVVELTNSAGFAVLTAWLAANSASLCFAGLLGTILNALASVLNIVGGIILILQFLAFSALFLYGILILLGMLGLGFKAGFNMRWLVVPVGFEFGLYSN